MKAPPAAWLEQHPSAVEVDSGLPSPRRARRDGDTWILRCALAGPLAPSGEQDSGWARIRGLEPGPDSALAPLATLLESGRLTLTSLAPRELLSLPGVNPARALRALRIKRVDRFLDRPLEIAHRVGPSYTLSRDFLRRQGERVVCLAPFEPQGWQALDVAQVALEEDADLSELHGGGAAGETALLLATLALALQRSWRDRDPESADRVRECLEALRSPPPERVHIRVHGPDWLDTRPWSGDRSASEARRILHNLDGLRVDGQSLRVDCTPPLHKGKRPLLREDRTVRRTRLFSRWEQGIQTDDEGLLSATPEALALDFVQGLSGRVLDGTCGVGALAIAAARRGCSVVACDLDGPRLEMARHNARIYGVELDLRCADVLDILRSDGPFDALILDPPWGGRDYDRQGMRAQDLPFPLLEALELAPPVVRLKLPRSFLTQSLPGDWRWSAAVDARGVFKFLVGRRP